MLTRAFIPVSSRGVRNFHSGRVQKSFLNMLDADTNKTIHTLYHKSSYVLAFLIPLGFLTAPSSLTLPFDLATGILMPFHAHVGVDNVIKDYVPKALRTSARVTLILTTTATILGLLKLNLMGPGISQTLKSLWCSVPDKKDE